MIVSTQHRSLISVLALALASRCSAQSTSAPAAQTISIGTEEFVVDLNNVILDGKTVSAGGSAITVNSEPVLMDIADDLFVGGTEVLTGQVAKVNMTSSTSSQNAVTSAVRARSSSSSVWTEHSSSTVSQPQGDLNTAGLQELLEFLQMQSKASETSQAVLFLRSTVQSAPSTTSPSGGLKGSQANSLLYSTVRSTPQSSSIASPSDLTAHDNGKISASSSGVSLSTSMISMFQSTLQSQNVASASTTIGRGGLSGQNTDTGIWTSSSFLENSTARRSSSLALSSLSSSTLVSAPAVNPTSGITTSAPPASSMPTTSSQPNFAAASSSVLILAGALLSLSAKGKSLSDEISLPPAKTSFIESIETIDSQVTDLKGLLGRLGGNTVAPPSCHASKSKLRFKKRDIVGDLDRILSDVECAAQDLTTLTIKINAETPIFDDISPALDDLGDTASDMEKSDEDDDDDDISTNSPSQARTSTYTPSQARISTDKPSQARTSTNAPSQTRISLGSQTMTSFGSTTLKSLPSSSAISSQTTTEYPCYSGPAYVDPLSISEDADEVSAFNALLPSLLSSEFGADLSGFITVAANATSSVNATSAVSATYMPAGGNGILADPTTPITALSSSSVQSSPPSRQIPAVSTSFGQAPTSSPIVTPAANIVAVLANPSSHPVCSMVLANAGDGCIGVDYCDCSSTYAPPLTSTVDGIVTSGCSYATQVSLSQSSHPLLSDPATQEWNTLAYQDPQPPANDCPVNSIALGVASAIIKFALASAASYDFPTFTPSTTTSTITSIALAPSLEIPEYSGLDTPAVFTPPEPTTSPSTPFPSILSHNDKGSSLCSSLNDGAKSCKAAYSYYNPEYLYLDYTAYVQSDDTTAPGSLAVVSPTADRGCTAMLMCAPGADGLYGKQIIAAFDALYSFADVKICGSVYLANGCWMTTDFCSKCEASVPCAALPVEVQPEQGGSWPCYFPNGTVWHG